MKKTEKTAYILNMIFPLLLCPLLLVTGCSKGTEIPEASDSSDFRLEMDLSENYDTSDPFVDARLFYVTEDTDSLELNFTMQFEGQTALIEIADNETDQSLWSRTWDESPQDTTFTVPLTSLQKDKEYVISFTGTNIKNTQIQITSDSLLIKERARPMTQDS